MQRIHRIRITVNGLSKMSGEVVNLLMQCLKEPFSNKNEDPKLFYYKMYHCLKVKLKP